jgi:hypothetical protein
LNFIHPLFTDPAVCIFSAIATQIIPYTQICGHIIGRRGIRQGIYKKVTLSSAARGEICVLFLLLMALPDVVLVGQRDMNIREEN